MPNLRLGLANYWLLLAFYAGALVLSISRLSKDKRDWLFEDPKQQLHGLRKLALRMGQIVALAFVALISLTPLPEVLSAVVVIGLATFIAGTVLVVVSIGYFARPPDDQPTLDGPYRISRNPQWVGLFLALFGLAISSSSWVLILLVVVVGLTYHIQILAEEQQCRAKYGPSYDAYLRTVPRYLLFL